MIEFLGSYVFVDDRFCHMPLKTDYSGRVIYEVVRIIKGKVLFWDEHIKRLNSSLLKAGIAYDVFGLLDIIDELVVLNHVQNINVKINIYCCDEVHVVIAMIPSFYPKDKQYEVGVKALTFWAEREDPSIKQLHVDMQKKVKAYLEKTGAYELLLVNQKGMITEGSRSNVFFIKGSSVITPFLRDVLAGVTRTKVIQICEACHINVDEANISVGDLNEFDAAFMTGTSPKVLPFNMVDNHSYKTHNPIIQTIQIEYNRLIDMSLS